MNNPTTASPLVVCDKCGDTSDSAPGLMCGRVEPESWKGPCQGTYQRPDPFLGEADRKPTDALIASVAPAVVSSYPLRCTSPACGFSALAGGKLRASSACPSCGEALKAEPGEGPEPEPGAVGGPISKADVSNRGPRTRKTYTPETKTYTPGDRVIQPRHGFYITTESKPPMSRKAALALLQAGLRVEGTPLRIVEAQTYEEVEEGDGRVLIEKGD